MMIPSSRGGATSAIIVVGIRSLEVEDAKRLLSWAINILSHPNHTIIALHILLGKEPKKLLPNSKDYKRFRRAQSFLLSVMADFSHACQSKQVHMEARVRYSSSVGNGLIQEAKRTTAEFLVLKASNFQPNRTITKYCMKNAPKGCSIISIGQLQNEASFDLKDKLSQEKSPRTVVLDFIEEGKNDPSSNTEEEDDNSSLSGDSSSISSTTATTTTTTAITKYNKESPLLLRRMASFFLKSKSIRRRRNDDITINVVEKQLQQPCLKYFSYHEISKATKDFHPDNMVGQGGYSEVYRGEQRDGKSIAVKRLAQDNTNPHKEKEFLVELGLISQVSHPNTASLIGYCVENGLYLIFPFSFNGNLFNALHGDGCKTLEWAMRYKIVQGIAKGLHYLHKCCKHRIIHRDIKASNVLLGPDYEPQITDFGLAKWVPSNNKCSQQHGGGLTIEGTFGYLAPEYFLHGVVDEKTDVFAFGILLLEIVSGRIPIDSSKQSLLLWAMPLMECGKFSELVDTRLEGEYDTEQLQKIVLIASCCVRHCSAWRPSMTEVLELLSNDQDSEIARKWGVPKSSSEDEIDDYSMIFGYSIPIDKDLEKAIAALEIM